MATVNNEVAGNSAGGRIVAAAIGIGLLAAAGVDDSAGAFEVAQIVMGCQLIAAACFVPVVARQIRRRVPPPVAPDNPSDEYGYIAFLEGEVLDLRATVAELNETIDTVLCGLESSSNNAALTASRLRRGLLHRG